MNKRIATVILASLTIIIVVAALVPFLPVRDQKYSELGILGPNQTASDYPTNVPANQSFLLYGFVENHQGNVQDYELQVKLGNQSTRVTNSTYATAPILATYWHILRENETWTFPMNLSVNRAGNETRIIFELWSYNVPTSDFQYTGLWHQIWLNVTI